MVTRKICVVTGTRAEYGLLRSLMRLIADDDATTLQLVVTGMHLSPEFGMTSNSIEDDGFKINRRIEMLLSSDSPVGIAKSTGLGMIGFADAFSELQPDILVVLGDRFEILSAVASALFARIPVAHIHGGETTLGAFDEGIRHAITKMSHFHFTAADEYRKRVIQLGENPDRVFNVGGLGVDAILETPLLTGSELEERLGFALNDRTLLVTFHPVTLESSTAGQQFRELLSALRQLDNDFRFIFTLPNADTGGRELIRLVNEFVSENSDRSIARSSLGQPAYWSAIKHSAAVVGNSSSGLLEAPTLKTPTVNIGDRQAGRLMASSVINCRPTGIEILQAINLAASPGFRHQCTIATNPYGNGGASRKIFKTLMTAELGHDLVKKHFYDLPANLTAYTAEHRSLS